MNGIVNIPLVDEEHEQAFFELLIVILLEILLNKLGRSLKLNRLTLPAETRLKTGSSPFLTDRNDPEKTDPGSATPKVPGLPGMTRFGRGVCFGAESVSEAQLPILKRPRSLWQRTFHLRHWIPGHFTPPRARFKEAPQAVMTRFYSLRVVYFWIGCLFQKKLSAPRAPIKKLDIIKGFK